MPVPIDHQEPILGTKLAAPQETLYQQWRAKLPKNLQYDGNYDLRGLYSENPDVKPSSNMHFTDKYKLPNHPTFSNESKYFNEKTRDQAGHWQETDSSWNYIPYNPSVKKPVMEKKEMPAKTMSAPSTVSSDQKALDWWGQYVNSPKYKQRLSAFYQYPDYVQGKRSALANNISLRENPGTGSSYSADNNEVAISDLQSKASKIPRDEIIAHEAAHSVNGRNNSRVAALSPKEADFILERNKQMSPDSRARFQTISKETGKPIQQLLDGQMHDVNPSENHSDINAFRYLLKKRGLYDAGTQDLTPEVLKKAGSDAAIKRSFIYKRLKESFDDKAIIEIMNKVAANKNTNKSTIA